MTGTPEDDLDEQAEQYITITENTDGGWAAEIEAAGDQLIVDLQDADATSEKAQAMKAYAGAACHVADQHANAGDVISYVEDEFGNRIASKGQTGKDTLKGAILPALKTLRAEQQADELTADDLTLDTGIGIDEYLEKHLEWMERIQTTDHVDNDTFYRLIFDDAIVEIDDGQHLKLWSFYQVLSSATTRELRTEIVSEQLADAIDGDVTGDDKAADLYAEKSLGPEERPWHGDQWNKCIANFFKEKADPQDGDPISGPRTDAWLELRRIIDDSLAYEDKEAAYSHGEVYWHATEDELWVPTKLVAAAVEDYATDRQGLAAELNSRGVVPDRLSGDTASYKDYDLSPPARWWVLDVEHDEVPVPDADTVVDGGDAFSAGVGAAADGGSMFGDDDTDDETDSATAGGDD